MKIFSVPLNPKLSEQEFFDFVDFCKTYKDFIYDVYFTCRIQPFTNDAMGDIFVSQESDKAAVEAALFLQQETGITVSATFNNIEVRPSQQNLDLWIKNFKPLYDSGVRSCTLPHTHWLLTGQVQQEFPELFIKNTILRKVSEARDVAKLAEAGFNYVNLDRTLMRDRERLKEIIKVKTKYNVKLSLLANEGCLGGCPVMEEHYQFNNTRDSGPQYFNDPISRVSCPKWDTQIASLSLKTADFPPWREDWIEFLDLGIDTIKMHGRESISRLQETITIIKRFAAKEDILFETFNDYLKDVNIKERPINKWRNYIKTCKFNCWECNLCEAVVKTSVDPMVAKVADILVESVNTSVEVDIEGLSSNRTKQLLNFLGSISKSYLEVGVLHGSTFCATIKNNNLKAYAVDCWEDTNAENGSTNLQQDKNLFISNVKKYKGSNKVTLFDTNFINVDKTGMENIDLMFYDADHSFEATSKSVTYFADTFANKCILVFDDANFEGVVEGARDGLDKAGLTVLYEKILLNEKEDPSMWWNGFYLVVASKEK